MLDVEMFVWWVMRQYKLSIGVIARAICIYKGFWLKHAGASGIRASAFTAGQSSQSAKCGQVTVVLAMRA
jgi:hypothetical protein